MGIRRFAVFGHFDGAALTPEGAATLTTSRSMHVQVVALGAPLKISATVTAATLVKAIAALADEVARVCPSAEVTSVNGIEVTIDRPRERLIPIEAS